MARPLVLIFQELAQPQATPNTPDLNTVVVGPAYDLFDYPDDASTILLSTAYGQLEARAGNGTYTGYQPPAAGSDADTDEAHAMALAGMFREMMGELWRDEWLTHGLTGVARAALPVVLSDDPTTAAGLAAAHAAEGEVSPELRQVLEVIMQSLAAEGVRVRTAEDLQRALESRPELKARLGAALNK